MTIIRRPDFAGGGITPEEKTRLDAHTQVWTKRALRTDPIEPDKIIPAIEGLYRTANLDIPRVVIVPSPLVMAIAGAFASAIWWRRESSSAATNVTTNVTTNVATRIATLDATYDATYDATLDATLDATRAATYDATRAATLDAARAATRAATLDATYDAMDVATRAATNVATNVATRDATRAATDAATRAATRAATYDATRIAMNDATDDAVYDAMLDAMDAATNAATRAATNVATRAATYDATDATRAATLDATRDATYDATYDAMDAATDAATLDAMDAATNAATTEYAWVAPLARHFAGHDNFLYTVMLKAISNWYCQYQGGNMWAAWDCYLTGARDVLGLQLPQHEAYSHWEQAAIHGGFRLMNPHFCMVCDFPEVLKTDSRNRPHCEDGPSHRWRDGWSLYHWHGLRVPAWIIEHPEQITVEKIDQEPNMEVRRVMVERFGLARYVKETGAECLDEAPELGVRLLRKNVGDETILMLHMRNSTVEPDGTVREFMSRLHSELKPIAPADLVDPALRERWYSEHHAQELTARNAVASSFGLYGEQYAPEVQS